MRVDVFGESNKVEWHAMSRPKPTWICITQPTNQVLQSAAQIANLASTFGYGDPNLEHHKPHWWPTYPICYPIWHPGNQPGIPHTRLAINLTYLLSTWHCHIQPGWLAGTLADNLGVNATQLSWTDLGHRTLVTGPWSFPAFWSDLSSFQMPLFCVTRI